jgi:hypothetical protein
VHSFVSGGIAFLKPYIRRGILPTMLKEIIDTRLMVKRSMKLYNQEAKKNPGTFFLSFLCCLQHLSKINHP